MGMDKNLCPCEVYSKVFRSLQAKELASPLLPSSCIHFLQPHRGPAVTCGAQLCVLHSLKCPLVNRTDVCIKTGWYLGRERNLLTRAGLKDMGAAPHIQPATLATQILELEVWWFKNKKCTHFQGYEGFSVLHWCLLTYTAIYHHRTVVLSHSPSRAQAWLPWLPRAAAGYTGPAMPPCCGDPRVPIPPTSLQVFTP